MSENQDEKGKKRKIEVDVKHSYENLPNTEKRQLSTKDKIILPDGTETTVEELLKAREEAEDLQEKFRMLSLEEFESEKERVGCEDEDVTTPTELAIWIRAKGLDDEDLNEKPYSAPEGSVSMPTERAVPSVNTKGKQYRDAREMVRDLYWKAYYDEKVDSKEKEEAKQKIEQLWKTFFTREDLAKMRMDIKIWQCPKCYREVVNSNVCDYCGYVNRVSQK